MRTIIIPDERPTSWNKYYSGEHWSKRNKEASRVHWLVRAHLDPESPIFDAPVDIEVAVYFKDNRVPLDETNFNHTDEPLPMFEMCNNVCFT